MTASAEPWKRSERVFVTLWSVGDNEEPEVVIDVVDSEVYAESLLGRTLMRGGCPYRVTSARPVAQLRWEVLGFGLPIHPGAR